MSRKQLLKRLIPPILFDLRDELKKLRYGRYSWKGIYQNFSDVPVRGPGFEGDVWVKTIQGSIWPLNTILKPKGSIYTCFTAENSLLPVLTSMIAWEQGIVRILDFGGGSGETFVYLTQLISDDLNIEFHVVEMPTICEIGRDVFKNDPRIQFHTNLPDISYEIDIVHISSALQYVENYQDLLSALCSLRPQYFLFVKLSAGDIPTYVTGQYNVVGSVIPYRFINLDELVKMMSETGYTLLLRGWLEREYDQSNFPEPYRLKRTCNLLFARR